MLRKVVRGGLKGKDQVQVVGLAAKTSLVKVLSETVSKHESIELGDVARTEVVCGGIQREAHQSQL